MKPFLLIIALFASSLSVSYSQDFNKGKETYKRGDYDKASMSTSLNEEELRDLSFGDDIVVDYEGINKINTGEGNDKVSTSDFKDFDIDGDGDYSDTMTDFIGFETDENPEI